MVWFFLCYQWRELVCILNALDEADVVHSKVTGRDLSLMIYSQQDAFYAELRIDLPP